MADELKLIIKGYGKPNHSVLSRAYDVTLLRKLDMDDKILELKKERAELNEFVLWLDELTHKCKMGEDTMFADLIKEQNLAAQVIEGMGHVTPRDIQEASTKKYWQERFDKINRFLTYLENMPV